MVVLSNQKQDVVRVSPFVGDNRFDCVIFFVLRVSLKDRKPFQRDLRARRAVRFSVLKIGKCAQSWVYSSLIPINLKLTLFIIAAKRTN
jgi:hypothetical protein